MLETADSRSVSGNSALSQAWVSAPFSPLTVCLIPPFQMQGPSVVQVFWEAVLWREKEEEGKEHTRQKEGSAVGREQGADLPLLSGPLLGPVG